MDIKITEKAKQILRGIQVGYFDTAKKWGPETYDEYYLYFNHPELEIRKYSLLVFAAALGNWHMLSAYVFRPLEEQKKDLLYTPNTVYILEDYVKAFIEHNDSIKYEFPYLYKLMIYYFINIDIKVGEDVHQVSQDTFNKLRVIIDTSGVEPNYRSGEFDFSNILREVGLPTDF